MRIEIRRRRATTQRLQVVRPPLAAATQPQGGVVSLPLAKATTRGEANPPSPKGCGGRPPSLASLLLDVLQGVRRRRRSWDLAAWRTQRGSREVVKPALRATHQNE